MSATLLSTIATNAAAAITTAAITRNGNALKVYSYDPRDMDTLPAVTIDGPYQFTRTPPEDRESQLGSNDWHLTYMLRIYVARDDPSTGSTDMRAILGQVIAAIDADRTFGASVLEASLVSGELSFTESDATRQMSIMECDLEVWALV